MDVVGVTGNAVGDGFAVAAAAGGTGCAGADVDAT